MSMDRECIAAVERAIGELGCSEADLEVARNIEAYMDDAKKQGCTRTQLRVILYSREFQLTLDTNTVLSITSQMAGGAKRVVKSNRKALEAAASRCAREASTYDETLK